MIEAEEAKDEVRRILTRLIGAEVRYNRLGYQTGPALLGFMNVRVDSEHGTRVIQTLHPQEAPWLISMFELRAQGTLDDQQIVDVVNKMGFRTRKRRIFNPKDRKEVIGYEGGKQLTVKSMRNCIQKPEYAGIRVGKWTDGKPIKTKSVGLVSIELFNQANREKIVISKESDGYKIYKNRPPEWQRRKLHSNPDYPYKQYILCSECKKPLYGSASRGRAGKHFPAYHCARNHKRFSIQKDKLHEEIEDFVADLGFHPEFITRFREITLEEWEKRRKQIA